MNQLQMPSKITDKKFIYMPQTEKVVESDEEWSRCGKWILAFRNADMEFLDKAWKDLQPLLADGPLIWLRASTAVLKDEGAHLHCFTGPGLEKIRRAASAIRQVVDFGGCMFYQPNKKTEKGISYRTGHKQITTYMHTYLGRFYKKNAKRWIPVDEDDKKSISLSREFYRQNYSGAHLDLPSAVEDVDFVCTPPEEEVAATCDNWEECGKWILSDSDGDLEFSDRAWAVLRPLLTDGTLLMLKASTARLGDEGSIVQCFTRPGEEEIRTAAEKIREVVDPYMGIMYYKQNQQTQARVGRRYGHKNISIYMYTHMGRLYRRDRINSWRLISIDRDQRDCSIPCRFYKENYGENEELPSRSPRRSAHFPLTRSGSSERLTNWFLKCNCSDTNAVYLPDVDRVWIVAKELFEEGSFAKLFWSKRDDVAEIRMYVPRVRDVRQTLALCGTIFEVASVRNPIFYTTGEENKIRYSYKYTAEGELYKQTSFAEKFVLQREG